MFSLEEDEAEERVMLMVDIADTFLAKPTLGYNMGKQCTRVQLSGSGFNPQEKRNQNYALLFITFVTRYCKQIRQTQV